MEPDKKQLAVANEVLEKLSSKFEDCVLAGGAPRDWSRGERAKDLDFFVYGEMSVEQTSELLGVEMKMLGEEKYVHSPFDVLEGVWEGETIQIIFTKAPTSERIKNFPANCSKIWYSLKDGGTFEWDYSFDYFSDLNVIILGNRGVYEEEAYYDKLVKKAWSARYRIFFGRETFLRYLGRGMLDYGRDGVLGRNGWVLDLAIEDD